MLQSRSEKHEEVHCPPTPKSTQKFASAVPQQSRSVLQGSALPEQLGQYVVGAHTDAPAPLTGAQHPLLHSEPELQV